MHAVDWMVTDESRESNTKSATIRKTMEMTKAERKQLRKVRVSLVNCFCFNFHAVSLFELLAHGLVIETTKKELNVVLKSSARRVSNFHLQRPKPMVTFAGMIVLYSFYSQACNCSLFSSLFVRNVTKCVTNKNVSYETVQHVAQTILGNP